MQRVDLSDIGLDKIQLYGRRIPAFKLQCMSVLIKFLCSRCEFVINHSAVFVDERTHVDLGVSTEAGVPSYPVFPPEPSSHGASAPAEHPHPQTAQDQSMSMDLGPERTEGEGKKYSRNYSELLKNVVASLLEGTKHLLFRGL